MERVNELIRQEISELVQRQVRDPRIPGLISVTDVRVSPDLGHAYVYISALGSDVERAAALNGLRQASGFIRRELRSRVDLRKVPELDFRLDEAMQQGLRINELLREVGIDADTGEGADSGNQST